MANHRRWLVLSLLVSAVSAQSAPAQRPVFTADDIEDASSPTLGDVIAIPVGAGSSRAYIRTDQAEQWYILGNQYGVRNVTRPTLTYFRPKGGSKGTAIIIAPGGGFNSLAWSNEGEPIAKWLADQGIAAFILKYRTIPTPRDKPGFGTFVTRQMGRLQTGGFRALPLPAEARADAIAAVGYLRANSARYDIDPKRIGFLGFSAGAVVGLGAAVSGTVSDRPNFLGLIYGPMFAQRVPGSPPPLFVARAIDDPLYKPASVSLEDNFGLIGKWRAQGGSVEMHLYSGGSHGFGTQVTGTTSEGWRGDFLRWVCAQNYC